MRYTLDRWKFGFDVELKFSSTSDVFLFKFEVKLLKLLLFFTDLDERFLILVDLSVLSDLHKVITEEEEEEDKEFLEFKIEEEFLLIIVDFFALLVCFSVFFNTSEASWNPQLGNLE